MTAILGVMFGDSDLGNLFRKRAYHGNGVLINSRLARNSRSGRVTGK